MFSQILLLHSVHRTPYLLSEVQALPQMVRCQVPATTRVLLDHMAHSGSILVRHFLVILVLMVNNPLFPSILPIEVRILMDLDLVACPHDLLRTLH
jgi:hypothetical protein